MRATTATQRNANSDLKSQGVRKASAGARPQRPTGRLAPTVPEGPSKTASRTMLADKPITHLLKGKKSPPQPSKSKKVQELKTTQAQDEAVDLQKILAYYRERVQAHEVDRQQYLNKMDKLRVKADVNHKTQWELQKRVEERMELEQAVVRCQAQLGNERGTIEELTSGQDDMKMKQNINKKKILQLLEQSNSVEQHIYYQKDESPEKIQQYYLSVPDHNVIGGKNTTAPLSNPRIEEVKSTLDFSSTKKPNILRTIYMPNYEVDQGREQVEILRKEIEEEGQFYKGLMKNLQEDKAGFEEQMRAKYMALNANYNQTLQQVHDKEKYNTDIVKDHISLKHMFEIEERAQQEENEAVRQQNFILRKNIRGICDTTKQTVKNAREEYENNAEEFTEKFRDQSKGHDIHISLIRDQYKKLTQMHESKMKNNLEKYEANQDKLSKIQTKRKLELEGFSSDLSNLEKRMIFYQNYISKLKKLVDQDRIVNIEEQMMDQQYDVIPEQVDE